MLVPLSSIPKGTIIYPESDGKPMAENTKQARWIIIFYDNLSAKFADRPDVFVAADNAWFPKENEPKITLAPDVYLVFGRPKGDRSSYKQWEENDVPITVAFEIRSPSNTDEEMDDKQVFYEEHGVEEYYDYNPETNYLRAFVRKGDVFVRVRNFQEFVSPRLGLRFEMTEPEMTVYHAGGERLLTFEELAAERRRAEERATTAEQRATTAEQRATTAEQRATTAEQRATTAENQSTDLRQRLARLADLSRKARLGQATTDELAELDRLEAAPP
jgi:Uma2 family endonuclease